MKIIYSSKLGILKGLRPAVIAMIGSAGMDLMILAFWNEKGVSWNIHSIDLIAVFIFALVLVILRKWKVNPIMVMVGAGILGLCLYSI